MAVAERPVHPDIPPEIFDEILHHLRSDIFSLKMISLVCNSWSVSSRRYLFDSLIITGKNMEACTVTPASESPYRTIASYVKKIEIQEAENLITIAPNSILSSLSSTVTHLSFFNCTFHHFIDFRNIVHVFQCLEGLSLQDVDFVVGWDISQHSSIDRPIRSSLRHLCLVNAPIKVFMAWLCNQPKMPCLTSLELGLLRGPEILFSCQIIHRSTQNLEHLSLHLDEHEESTDTYMYAPHAPMLTSEDHSTPQEETLEVFELYRKVFGVPHQSVKTVFQSLRTLRINNFFVSSRKEQNTACHWLPRLLAKIGSSGSFVHFVVQMDVARAGDLDKYDIPWDFYDRALLCESFRNLRCWEFEIVGKRKTPLDAIYNILSLRLPRLARRRLLRFSRPPSIQSERFEHAVSI